MEVHRGKGGDRVEILQRRLNVRAATENERNVSLQALDCTKASFHFIPVQAKSGIPTVRRRFGKDSLNPRYIHLQVAYSHVRERATPPSSVRGKIDLQIPSG
jgi:hypothetical protein